MSRRLGRGLENPPDRAGADYAARQESAEHAPQQQPNGLRGALVRTIRSTRATLRDMPESAIIRDEMEQPYQPSDEPVEHEGLVGVTPPGGEAEAPPRDWPGKSEQEGVILAGAARALPITAEERAAFPDERLQAILDDLPEGVLDGYLDELLGPIELSRFADEEDVRIAHQARAARFMLTLLGVSAAPTDKEALARELDADHRRHMARFREMLPEILAERERALLDPDGAAPPSDL
jgi:hypothetical protein